MVGIMNNQTDLFTDLAAHRAALWHLVRAIDDGRVTTDSEATAKARAVLRPTWTGTSEPESASTAMRSTLPGPRLLDLDEERFVAGAISGRKMIDAGGFSDPLDPEAEISDAICALLHLAATVHDDSLDRDAAAALLSRGAGYYFADTLGWHIIEAEVTIDLVEEYGGHRYLTS